MQAAYLLGYLKRGGNLEDIYVHKHDRILFKDFLRLKTDCEYVYWFVITVD
jgi:hypothetical protein